MSTGKSELCAKLCSPPPVTSSSLTLFELNQESSDVHCSDPLKRELFLWLLTTRLGVGGWWLRGGFTFVSFYLLTRQPASPKQQLISRTSLPVDAYLGNTGEPLASGRGGKARDPQPGKAREVVEVISNFTTFRIGTKAAASSGMAQTLHRDDDDDAYAGADTSGVEVVSGGSVTSFVRKLFQMVQGECNSIVGFVAGGLRR